MKKYIKIILAISIILNISLVLYTNFKSNQVKYAVSFIADHSIQGNIVKLEGAINHQIDTGWENHYAVTEKINDVVQGIGLVRSIDVMTGVLSKDQKNTLIKLDNYFNKYPRQSVFPYMSLTDNEKENLERLSKNLRNAGWGMNQNYSGGWESLSEYVNLLVSTID